MILEALVSQIEQRFQHEKRARVCLWFDERQEFRRILPSLESHVASRPLNRLRCSPTTSSGTTVRSG